jgi:hypothetical protein
MRQRLLLTAVVLLAVTGGLASGVAQAVEGELHGSIDVTYQTKNIWRGFDAYGDKSAIQPTLDLNLFGTGFGMSVQGHRANSSGYENGERWDYTLYYQNRMFGEETYATNYRLGWVYYNYPDNPSEGAMTAPNAALQELHAVLSLPKICPAGVVPTYVLVKMWPSESGSFSGARSARIPVPGFGGTASGFAHIFMLDYGLHVPGLLPEIPEHVLNLHSEVVYNDGIGPAGQDVDHDWSNAVFGVSTDISLAENLTFTPGIYYQISMEESVDDEDELWSTFGLKYKF